MLTVRVRSGHIASLRRDGREVGRARLTPPLLASYYGPDLIERRPARLGELPPYVAAAVLAAEDNGFYRHGGLSITAILRAAWVDLAHGEMAQGGSTLTQQLVKNLYLSQRRTLWRKLREAVLAVVLEARASKDEILTAYLNEVYLGASDHVNLVGLGAGARAFFGTDAEHLDLAQAATLAGMIAAPGRYSPLAHPEAARARRDRVLRRLGELQWVDGGKVEAALAAPLATAADPPVLRRAPYFADAARREAAARYGLSDLADAGYTLLATLDLDDQRAAEEAVAKGLADIEARRKQAPSRSLQAALVSLAPADGAILAWVGGRDWAASQFDRAADAARQAGSAFKPVVYAAAFADGVLAPASLVDDTPLTLEEGGESWSPSNDDGAFRGAISVREALADSRNLPAVRVALAEGLDGVVRTAQAMGISSPLAPVPSLALGACDVTPVALATVYATLAAGGLRPPVHGLGAVLDPAGQLLTAPPLPPPDRALDPAVAGLVTSVLQDTLDEGTGAAVRRLGLSDPLAGKTGTSNGGRDTWFCGYSPDRATAVWVGYDDNTPTHLSGARAALPVWTRFILAVRPTGGYPSFREPAGVVHALVDPASGELATSRCPETRDEVFLAGHAPTALCHLHSGFWAHPVEQPEGAPQPKRPGRLRRLLQKIFGKR